MKRFTLETLSATLAALTSSCFLDMGSSDKTIGKAQPEQASRQLASQTLDVVAAFTAKAAILSGVVLYSGHSRPTDDLR